MGVTLSVRVEIRTVSHRGKASLSAPSGFVSLPVPRFWTGSFTSSPDKSDRPPSVLPETSGASTSVLILSQISVIILDATNWWLRDGPGCDL